MKTLGKLSGERKQQAISEKQWVGLDLII